MSDFWDSMNFSLPSSSVYGILQARIMDWATIPFFRASSWSRDQTQVSCIAGRFLTIWATREAYRWKSRNYKKKKKKPRKERVSYVSDTTEISISGLPASFLSWMCSLSFLEAALQWCFLPSILGEQGVIVGIFCHLKCIDFVSPSQEYCENK